MKEKINLLRILPEMDSAYTYRIGTPPEEIDSDSLEDTDWELYFAQTECEGSFELVDESDDFEDDNFDLGPCRRLSSIIYVLTQDNPEGLSSEEISEIKEIYGNPKFDKGVPDIYKDWIKSLSKPGITEEEALISLFKSIIKETDLENPVGIEVDSSEEEQMRIGYNINVGENGFDIDKIEFISFECPFEDFSLAFEALQDSEIALLNLVLYDGVFYHNNTGDDDGFVDGCDMNQLFLVDKNNLKDMQDIL